VQREKHHYTKKGVSCMKNLKVLAVAGVVSAVMFTGCEKAPQVEIEKAKQAVTAAETEASAYAADKVAAAKAALDSALAAVKANLPQPLLPPKWRPRKPQSTRKQ
jgi:hypothetical protein